MNTDRLTQKGFVAALAADRASSMHEEWRMGFQAKNGASAQRFKDTVDAGWVAANDGQPYCQGGQVNINIEFDLLPSDWKKENIGAAEFVFGAVAVEMLRGVSLDEINVDEIAAKVHEAWLSRRAVEGDTYWHDLLPGFEGLPEDEAAKDVEQVQIAIAAFREALTE